MIFEEIKNRSITIAIKDGVNSLGIFESFARMCNRSNDLDFIMDDDSIDKYIVLPKR